jgi:hypothetical protein
MVSKTSMQRSTFEHTRFTNTMLEFQVVCLSACAHARMRCQKPKKKKRRSTAHSKEVRNFHMHNKKRQCKRDGICGTSVINARVPREKHT